MSIEVGQKYRNNQDGELIIVAFNAARRKAAEE